MGKDKGNKSSNKDGKAPAAVGKDGKPVQPVVEKNGKPAEPVVKDAAPIQGGKNKSKKR
jgi:hypothetical protein